MINLFLNKVIEDEYLSSLNLSESYHTRNIANKLVNILKDLSDPSFIYNRSIFYVEVDDEDLLDEVIQFYIKVDSSNIIYIQDQFNNEYLMDALDGMLDLENINVFSGNVISGDNYLFKENLTNKFMELSDMSVLEDLFPTDSDKYYSFYIFGEFNSVTLSRNNEDGCIISDISDEDLLDSNRKRILINLLKRKFPEDEF